MNNDNNSSSNVELMPSVDQPTATPKKKRGFAAMDRALVSQIAAKGGKAAHAHGTAHEFSPEEAREAGRKGGRAAHAKMRAARENREPKS